MKMIDMMSAFNSIKPDLKNINWNDENQLMTLLTRKGWKPNMITEFLSWAKTTALPIARGAKAFGIDPVKKYTGVDIDNIDFNKVEQDIRKVLSPSSYSFENTQQYKSEPISYGVRSNKLSDKYD